MWAGEFLWYDMSAPWPQQVSRNSGHTLGLARVAGAVYAFDTSDFRGITCDVYISQPGMTRANQCIRLHSPLLRSPAGGGENTTWAFEERYVLRLTHKSLDLV